MDIKKISNDLPSNKKSELLNPDSNINKSLKILETINYNIKNNKTTPKELFEELLRLVKL